MDATVAILAGGRATRMGRPKATLELGGHPLISYPLAAAQAAGLDQVVVAKRDSELPELPCRVIVEPDEPSHPLAGVVAAVRDIDGPVLAMGCDMPFADDKLLAWVASHLSTTTVMGDGRVQPFLTRFDHGDLPRLEASLERGEAMQEAILGLDPLVVPETDLVRFGDPRLLTFNVNTPEDLAEAEAMLLRLAPRPVPR